MGVFERTLTIKRVPTVLSNYQEEDGNLASENLGCGRNCLGKCCLLGMFLFVLDRFSIISVFRLLISLKII